ncbi:sodium:solute symporter family protein [Yeosuana sp. AK3]
MSIIDYVVIIVFTVLIVIAGLSFRKRGSDMKSYFAAGGAVPWTINGLSLYMSFFSAGTFVVWGSIAYEFGWVAITIQMAMCVGGFVVAYVIAPKWRKTNVLTAAEFVRKRLGDKVQKFYTYIILILSLAYTGAFLYPVAKIVNVSTGWPINACIIGLGLLILLYTVVGGLWAVIVTDVLQFMILTAAVFLVVILAFEQVGGLNGFLSSLPADAWKITSEEYSWWFILAFAVYNIIFIGGNWAYVQRYTSVKNAKDAKKVGLTFGWLYLISPFIWMLPPMIYKIINPNLSGLESEGAYMLICKQVLPIGMLGLMLGGMVFATASSVNTTLNLAASVITNDLFLVFKPKASLKQVMNVAKLSTVIFGIGTILVALLVPSVGGIVNVVLSIGAVIGCSLYGPPIWALFSKRHSGKSILIITLISLSINIGFKFFYTLSRADEMLLGTLSPFLLLAIYELYAKFIGIEKSEDYVKYDLLRTPDLAASADIEQNVFGMKVLANTLTAIGVLIIGLGIISASSKLLIILIGTIIFSMALFIHPFVKLKKIFK